MGGGDRREDNDAAAVRRGKLIFGAAVAATPLAYLIRMGSRAWRILVSVSILLGVVVGGTNQIVRALSGSQSPRHAVNPPLTRGAPSVGNPHLLTHQAPPAGSCDPRSNEASVATAGPRPTIGLDTVLVQGLGKKLDDATCDKAKELAKQSFELVQRLDASRRAQLRPLVLASEERLRASGRKVPTPGTQAHDTHELLVALDAIHRAARPGFLGRGLGFDQVRRAGDRIADVAR